MNWKSGIVAILGGAGTPVGAGFSLCGARGLLITCEHVARTALGVGELAAGADGPRIQPYASAGVVATRVVFASPVNDLCVLEPSTPGQNGLSLELTPVTQRPQALALGFPEGIDRAVEDPDIRLDTRLDTRDGRRSLLQLSSERITAGFSGGPIVDNQTGRVLGVITETLVPDKLGKLPNVAYAIPIDVLLECLSLRTLVSDWMKALTATSRVTEIALCFSTVHKRLKTISDAQGDITGADNLFLQETQDYLASSLTAEEYQARRDAEQPRGTDTNGATLTHRLQDGSLAVFLGSRFFVELGLTLSSQRLAALLQKFAQQQRASSPPVNTSLPRISHYLQLAEGRTVLRREFVRALETCEAGASATLDGLTEALGRARSALILTTFYDSLLESVLKRAKVNFQVACREVTTERGAASADTSAGTLRIVTVAQGQRDAPEKVTDLSISRPLENGLSLVYRICGGLSFEHQADGGASDTLVVADADFFDFAQRADSVLPDYVVKHWKGKTVLFLGCDLGDWQECMILYSLVKHLRGSKEPAFAAVGPNDPYGQAFWQASGVRIVQQPLARLLQEL